MKKIIYFVNNYKTRHIMESTMFYKLKDAKLEAIKLGSVNDGSAIVRQDCDGNKLIWASNDIAKYYACEIIK